MVVTLSKYVNGCNTNEDGEIIFNIISSVLTEGKEVTLSFKGITSVTSSFLNSALAPLVPQIGFNNLKKLLRIVESNKFINNMISHRLIQESELVGC